MLRIGVTGRMASGKSTVARRFEELGAARIDGDALGWEVLRAPDVKRAIAAAFGPEHLDAKGAVDRPRLGRAVFSDPDAMARLNAIVQPPLLARVRAALEAATGPAVVLDAALIGAWGLAPELDAVVEVTAPEAERIRRLMEARGFDEGEARLRAAGQRLEPVLGARTRWIIENDADEDALLRRADRVWEEILRLHSSRT